MALSNMVSQCFKDCVAYVHVQDVKETSNVDNNMKRVVFNRTPVMSTYLLAFIVGEYDYIEERDSNGVLVRVFTPVGKKEEGRFALQVNNIIDTCIQCI